MRKFITLLLLLAGFAVNSQIVTAQVRIDTTYYDFAKNVTKERSFAKAMKLIKYSENEPLAKYEIYDIMDMRLIQEGYCSSVDDGGKMVKQGIQYIYHPNGKISVSDEYKDGKPDGKRMFYNDKGQLEAEVPYQNGVQRGVSKLYYPNGNVKWEAWTENDKNEGFERTYYENGKLETSGVYRNDLKHGVFTRYDQWGGVIQTARFIDDVQQR